MASHYLEAAKEWSKDRIREEIADIRAEIEQFRREALEIRSKTDDEVAEINSGNHPRSNEDDPYKHTDLAYESASNLDSLAERYQNDIEFLKSLL